jgi:two-component system, NarL family, capsular synthesis sensor histidine kinase RcsC
MRLKNYLHQISPVLSTPHAARRLLRIFALVLLVGMLGGVYSFLLFTFNNEISQRRKLHEQRHRRGPYLFHHP